MFKLLLAILISLSAFAATPNLEMVRTRYEGCYSGMDDLGRSVSASINLLQANPAGLTFRINGKPVDSIRLSLNSHDSNTALVTHLFENGTFINSEILNDQIAYEHTGVISRSVSGQLLGQFKNHTLITFKSKEQKYRLEVFQNDNSEFLSDVYAGSTRTNSRKYQLEKVPCL